MNLLKSIETTIANLIKLGRVFRSEVRPMELAARELAREIDANRTVSVSRVYVPTSTRC